jgi:hypothetical protein
MGLLSINDMGLALCLPATGYAGPARWALTALPQCSHMEEYGSTIAAVSRICWPIGAYPSSPASSV